MVLPKHISDTINDKSKENTLRSSAVKVYLIRCFKNDDSAQHALDDLIEYAVELRRAIRVSERTEADGLSEQEAEVASNLMEYAGIAYNQMKVYNRAADFLLSLSYPKE